MLDVQVIKPDSVSEARGGVEMERRYLATLHTLLTQQKTSSGFLRSSYMRYISRTRLSCRFPLQFVTSVPLDVSRDLLIASLLHAFALFFIALSDGLDILGVLLIAYAALLSGDRPWSSSLWSART